MFQKKTRIMVFSSNVADKIKGYDIFLECLRQKQGLWYTPRMPPKNKGYDILLDVLTRTDGLWCTPRMAQTSTNGMIYSSNV